MNIQTYIITYKNNIGYKFQYEQTKNIKNKEFVWLSNYNHSANYFNKLKNKNNWDWYFKNSENINFIKSINLAYSYLYAHKEAIEKFYKSGFSHALIMEDVCLLPDNIYSTIEKIYSDNPTIHWFNFSEEFTEIIKTQKSESNELTVKNINSSGNSICYVIDKVFARRFLNMFLEIPINLLLQKIYNSYPCVFGSGVKVNIKLYTEIFLYNGTNIDFESHKFKHIIFLVNVENKNELENNKKQNKLLKNLVLINNWYMCHSLYSKISSDIAFKTNIEEKTELSNEYEYLLEYYTILKTSYILGLNNIIVCMGDVDFTNNISLIEYTLNSIPDNYCFCKLVCNNKKYNSLESEQLFTKDNYTGKEIGYQCYAFDRVGMKKFIDSIDSNTKTIEEVFNTFKNDIYTLSIPIT